MVSSVNQSKIVIPTGFESQQRQLERRSAISQALLERGLAGPGANATSWTQPLASIVQALAGRLGQKKVDRQQGELEGQIKDQYTSKVAQVQQDILDAGNDPQALQQVVFKYQSDPLVAEIIKPVAERFGKMQSAGDAPREAGGIIAPTRDFMSKGILPGDPTKDRLIADPANPGQLVVNPGWVAASQAAQGLQAAPGSVPFQSQPDSRQAVVQSMMAQRAGGPAGYPGMPASESQPGFPPMAGQELPALPTGPQAGDRQEGYLFLGGNPADPRSWRKIQ